MTQPTEGQDLTKPSVRLAGEQDVDSIVRMGHRFYETTYYGSAADFCEESARRVVDLAVGSGVVAIASRADKPIGMLGLLLLPFVFNQAKTFAYETFWWVDPDERGGRTALAMLKLAEAECERRGVTAIQMASLETSPPSVGSLYRRLGYSPSEHFYTKLIGRA